jgi:hypothetical protein
MPPALGWILVVGGVGHVLSTFVSSSRLVPPASLPLAATVGEVWMVGYLLIRGLPEGPPVPRRRTPEPAAA